MIQLPRPTFLASNPSRQCAAGVALLLVLAWALTACGSTAPSVDQGERGDKPASLPAFASLDLYSQDSPLNQPIPDSAEVDPHSDQYIRRFASVIQEGGFVIELKQFSTTVYTASPRTPRLDVELRCGRRWVGVEALTGVPIPAQAEPARDAGGVLALLFKGMCGAFSPQDNQMVVLDLENRCEYDFWQIQEENGKWSASWGNAISMDSSGIYEKGLSARGSGFTQLAGQIWPDELEKGRISHALIFSYTETASGGPVWPATESDGTSDDPWALPEGTRLRLDPELDLDALDLTPYEQTIARALQEYGMFLVDTSGSGVSLEAIDPRSVSGNPYAGLLPDVDYPPLSHLPADRFQVLKLPPQDPLADEKSELVDSRCAAFR